MSDTPEDVRAVITTLLGESNWHLSAAISALHHYADLLEQCAPYLKDGETPAQRIERDHLDTLRLMEQLGREKGVTELAYGWLWHVNSDDKRVHAARKVLLSGINLLGQAAGINRAKEAGARV